MCDMADSVVSEKPFEFPECWSDEIRMSALFAPFRSKSVNPTDRDSKLKFWTDLIKNWCKHNKCPLIDISSLKNTFSRKGSVPACLDEVLEHMISAGILVSQDDFMTSDENWKNWAIKVLVKNPLRWTLNSVKNTMMRANGVQKTYYVHLPVVKELSEELQRKGRTDFQEKLVTYEHLMALGFENLENLTITLHWMQKHGLVAICCHDNVELVKVPKNVTTPVSISEADLGIYSLEKQQKLLEENIANLELERNTALEETKRHLSTNMKNLAKITLRRKKEVEKTLEKRAATLENIQALLRKIDQAKLDGEVIDCYRKGIASLKHIFKENGLCVDAVTGTMKELEAVLNSRDEIEQALARPMDATLEENLEEELNELLLREAPQVPLDEPPITSKQQQKKEKENERKLTSKLQALSI